MSDVVWAAAIAGGVGLAGNAFTYLAARANRRLDLARLEAENERFHGERREPERQNRQGTYHRLLAVLDRYDMWATGYAEGVDDATLEATLAEHNYLLGAVHLFGAEEVRQATGPLVDLFAQVGERMARAQSPTKVGRFVVAYRPHRNEIVEATANLTLAMRADVTKGLLPE